MTQASKAGDRLVYVDRSRLADVAARLTAMVTAAGVSRSDVAREAKLTNSTVSVYLHGSCLHMRRAIVLRIIAATKRAEAEELERIDAMTAAKVWADDSLIDELHVERCMVIPGGWAIVAVADRSEAR